MKDALGDTFPEVSGASVSKGCISECASEMSAEYKTVTSGHVLRKESAMWEYCNWTLPAGANTWNHIAGWPARPWGQCTTCRQRRLPRAPPSDRDRSGDD